MDKTVSTICGYRVETAPPALFNLGKRLKRWKVRGGYRLQTVASPGHVVEYDLGDGFHLTVPIYRPDNQVDLDEVLGYEVQLLKEMGEAAEGMRSATLVDCGADIGLMSVMLCRSIPAISYLVAFEPNAEVLPFLNRNLSMLPRPALMLGHAVGNLNGTGRLERSAMDSSDHACYLVSDPKGGIRIITIDSLNLSGDVVLKIDVEGAETSVLEGARETILQAPQCVVSLEVHPAVAERTGQDPAQAMRYLSSLRPFHFVVTGNTARWELESIDQPLYREGAEREVLNVVASTRI